MNFNKKNELSEWKDFLILWSTQSVSQLGSSITTFALTLWLYEKTGSSLSTASLTICSHAPYVIMSIFALFSTDHLMVWHLYVLNAVSGLMNTIQQPASEVAMTLIIPDKYYQKTSGLRSLSRSLISILNPLIATALYAFIGLNGVIAVDIGSLLVMMLPKPKDRVKVIYRTMLFSLGTENFLLAFSRNPVLWCIGQGIGWVLVPIMDANLDVILRTNIPVELQGRVYACRNTLQFFTILIGLFLGGFMVDHVCEPFMNTYGSLPLLKTLFGIGKGSGAALMMFVLGVCGSLICIITGRNLKNYSYND